MAVRTFLAIGIGTAVFVALLALLDLVFAGGTGTKALIRSLAMAMNNPVARAILFAVIVMLGVLLYAVFFR